ncbi:MAG: hypothetical protein QOG60_154, partial [Frankiaceae bacterium]|nr:hypothetical protein [Frankiaceae bacterium]
LERAGATPLESYEVTTACCAAVTNSIEHAYGPGLAWIEVSGELRDREVGVTIVDSGSWRAPRAERNGRGLRLMEAFSDTVTVTTTDTGTTVALRRKLTIDPTPLTTSPR